MRQTNSNTKVCWLLVLNKIRKLIMQQSRYINSEQFDAVIVSASNLKIGSMVMSEPQR
ncbi:hypothetical protein [Pediococcus cellicola]|uniref:hypothetical protein n=1 Tax=Pediococcus cellicola TaxID=319652 RepID=UPI000A73101F|nr:hypothetical protein [Pediococcus cellicola]